MDRPFDLDPAHDQARLPFRGRQRVLEASGAGTGAEEPHGVDLDGFARDQQYIDIRDGHLGIQVDVGHPTHHVRRRERVYGHRFGPPTGGDVVEVRDEPALCLAGADPDGMPAKFDPVATGDRRLEGAELRLDRLVGAGDDADALEFALGGVGLADRRRGLAGADLRLGRVTQRREGRALGGRVEDRELHRADVAALVAGEEATRRARQFLGRGDEHLAERVLRGREVTGKLHMRDVQRLTALVEAM